MHLVGGMRGEWIALGSFCELSPESLLLLGPLVRRGQFIEPFSSVIVFVSFQQAMSIPDRHGLASDPKFGGHLIGGMEAVLS